jgi:hypothetical protein
MADLPVKVVTTSKVTGLFEDYLSMNPEEKTAHDPKQPQNLCKSTKTDLSQEIDQSQDDKDDGQLEQAFIHPDSGLEIPYPPGAETALLREFKAEFDDEDVNHLVTIANRMILDRTAEIAANSPRYRRRSSTFIDGVHDVPDVSSSPMAPAQLYSTMSGRLFHSGRIAIVLVGPPARGKT